MNDSCNTGTVSTSIKGWCGGFEVWPNKKGIANVFSIPMLAAVGYLVSTHTHGNWVVTSTKRKETIFKQDTGMCNRFSYIDLKGRTKKVLQ